MPLIVNHPHPRSKPESMSLFCPGIEARSDSAFAYWHSASIAPWTKTGMPSTHSSHNSLSRS